MALNPALIQFTVKTRDEDLADFLESFQFRNEAADITKGSDPWVLGSVGADMRSPLWSIVNQTARQCFWFTATGTQLREHASQLGWPARDAVGGSGFVICEAASGGATPALNAEMYHEATGAKYRVTESRLFLPGDLIPVQGINPGPGSNRPAGSILKWRSPPAGMHGTARVFQNADGSGISGGANAETDEEVIDHLVDAHADSAASGNDADIVQYVEKLTGIAIQKAFHYALFPGVYAVAITMRPSEVGASRLPNDAHLERLGAELAAFPGDDGQMVPSVLDDPFRIAVRIRWLPGTDWYDSAPWPPYGDPPVIVDDPSISATGCRLLNCTTAPTVGKNIGFYDAPTRSFKRKRISAVTPVVGTTYDVDFDMTAGASDPVFIPPPDAIVSPWSDAMVDSTYVAPLLAYVDRQGPGEMVASFLDPGRRQKRWPFSAPKQWPSEVGSSLTDGLDDLVDSHVLMEPTVPLATTVGTPGTLVYLHTVSDIGFFAL